jgi:hypothetical protein
MEWIETALDACIKLSLGEEIDLSKGPLAKAYFAGQGLCLDIRNPFTKKVDEVIKLSWDQETTSFFSGGPKRLLSIAALKKLKKLMQLNDIKYLEKEHICG